MVCHIPVDQNFDASRAPVRQTEHEAVRLGPNLANVVSAKRPAGKTGGFAGNLIEEVG